MWEYVLFHSRKTCNFREPNYDILSFSYVVKYENSGDELWKREFPKNYSVFLTRDNFHDCSGKIGKIVRHKRARSQTARNYA